MHRFKAKLDIIGINPFVFVPDPILLKIFEEAGKSKGPIPICGIINEKPYHQTLVKYGGEWRLYVNTMMLKNSPKRIGETVELTILFDGKSREVRPPKDFIKALSKNKEAEMVFNHLSPSRKLEIVRYLTRLKTGEALKKNIPKAILFLTGKGRFVGRDKP